MEVITSRQNPKIKSIAALSEKKGREKQGLFRFDGIKLFSDALGRVTVSSVVVRVPMSDAVEVALNEALACGAVRGEHIIYVSESVFERLTEESSPEGIITVAEQPAALHVRAGKPAEAALGLAGDTLLIAESLRDPGNLGTVMRSCAALGIDTLILSDDCADLYNPRTVRSTMGALFRMPTLRVKREELPLLIRSLRDGGRRVFAAALTDEAEEIGSIDLRAGDCFVIGNEGHGLSAELIEACDSAAIIPMVEGNESLNAAAAATICIWETVKASGRREQSYEG